jgi:hypothetical protein
MSQILSSLKLVTAKRQSVQNPTEFRRQKISQKLLEQIQMANALKNGETNTAKRQRNVRDKESGLMTTVEVNKRVRQWWFVTRDTNKVAVQLRYGTKVIEFAKGKNAIEVSSGEELIATLQKLRTATLSGELDDCINSASVLVKARFQK